MALVFQVGATRETDVTRETRSIKLLTYEEKYLKKKKDASQVSDALNFFY